MMSVRNQKWEVLAQIRNNKEPNLRIEQLAIHICALVLVLFVRLKTCRRLRFVDLIKSIDQVRE